MRKSTAFLIGIALIGSLIGCHDALSPAARDLRPVTKPAHNMQALDPVTVSLPATPHTIKNLAIFPYPEGVFVEMSISDRIFVTSTENAWIQWNNWLDGGGIKDVDSSHQCALRIFIYYPNIGNKSPPGCDPPTMATFWVDTVIAQGTGTVKRGGGIIDGPQCSSGNCHTWVGSQTVTILPLAADLSVTPASVFLTNLQTTRPQYTTFTVAPYPDSIRHQAVPTKVTARSWRRADPTVSAGADTTTPAGNCSLNTLYCNLPVKESGILTISARANGVGHTVFACVQCVSTDAQLNDQVLRDSLIELSLRSNPSPAFSTHLEHVLMIVENMYNHKVYTIPITVTNPSPCYSQWTIPARSQIPDSVNLIAFAHTHPSNSLGPSQTCPDGKLVGGPGGSIEFDWPAMAQWNAREDYHQAGWFNIPMYIIANDFVYKMDPTKGPGSDKKAIMRWNKGRCAWAHL